MHCVSKARPVLRGAGGLLAPEWTEIMLKDNIPINNKTRGVGQGL